MKDNTNIVIIRQYGSGGREVSSILAKKLGFHRYDRTIVQMAAEKLSQQEGYDIDVDELLKDSYDLPQNQLGNLGDFAFERIPYFNKMYRQQAVAMLKLAQKGKAVFLGRCADFILKDVPNTFFFFMVFAFLSDWYFKISMLFLDKLDYSSAEHAARHAADSIVDHIIPLK